MAPEQARGDCALDHRVDQFAVAAMTYEMLTGRRALSSDDADGSGVQARHVTPLSELAPWVPAAFDAALERALSNHREQRHASIARFAWALGKAASQSALLHEEVAAVTFARASGGRYHLARPREERVNAVSVRPSSGPPTQVDGRRHRAESGVDRVDSLALAQDLLRALRETYAAGMCHQAVEHAEELLDMALHGAEPPTLRVISAGMPLIDRVFAAIVGPLDGVVAAAADASALEAQLSPRAASVLAHIEKPMTVAEVLSASTLPTRDCIRVLASLLRKRALVHATRRA
jgi:hypothetical protein